MPDGRQFLNRLWGRRAITLDAYATSMVHLYDPARRWLTAYTGNLVRLRRASDNAEANFGYTSDGNLETAAIAAWAGGASYVVTLYDQKGGDNVTQATAASQPLFTASAQNGHAGMTFDGTNDFLQGAFTNGGALSQPFSIYTVAKLDASGVNNNVDQMLTDSDDTANRLVIYKKAAGTPDNWSVGFGVDLDGGAADSNWNILSILANGASSEYWINTVSKAAGNVGAHNADGLTLGARFNNIYNWKGLITSVIIVDPAHSDADRVLVQTILNNYWAAY